jgi:hypothetical protein
MQVRALKSFSGKYGSIRTGQKFNCDPHYADQLFANSLIEAVQEPGPDNNRAIPQAPQRSKTPPPEKDTGKGGATADSGRTPAGGKPITSRSLRADLALRKKTSPSSGDGGTNS